MFEQAFGKVQGGYGVPIPEQAAKMMQGMPDRADSLTQVQNQSLESLNELNALLIQIRDIVSGPVPEKDGVQQAINSHTLGRATDIRTGIRIATARCRDILGHLA